MGVFTEISRKYRIINICDIINLYIKSKLYIFKIYLFVVIFTQLASFKMLNCQKNMHVKMHIFSNIFK